MPFHIQTFQENIHHWVADPARKRLSLACEAYATLTNPRQKARCLQSMIAMLDQAVDEKTRRTIMEACGRRCLGDSIVERALRLRRQALDLDDLLKRLNEANVGGGSLRSVGDAVQATYDRCYCGSVSDIRKELSPTYCYCTCGWHRRLFETLFGRPVRVELTASIIRGDSYCRILIRW